MASGVESKEARTSTDREELLLARNHTYLPGASHPLHVAVDGSSSAHLKLSRNGDSLLSLPVLFMQDVVIFPGNTLPLRFTSSSPWFGHILRLIQDARSHPGTAPVVRIGVLSVEESAVSTDDGPFLRGSHRRSWTRQGLGPTRLRRFSEQLLLQMESFVEDLSGLESEDDENEDEVLPRQTQGRTTTTALTEEQEAESAQRRHYENTSHVSTKQDRCGYIGRIGTIVTVMSTHESTEKVGDGIWQTSSDRINELVVTAKGTSRFRIMDYSSADQEENLYFYRQRYGKTSYFASAQNYAMVPQFEIEELHDGPIPMPSLPRPYIVTADPAMRSRRLLQTLSNITAIPISPSFWPASCVARIKEKMTASPGLYTSLLDTWKNANINSSSIDDPVQVSFWLATHLPLTITYKLHVLSLRSTLERLLFLSNWIESQLDPVISCRTCSLPLARSSALFTLSGAEGTTGAYVNRHGHVHETMTIRSFLSPSSPRTASNLISLVGCPETIDSWFPGYAWTIMQCALCDSHLGWRFTKVKEENEEEQQQVEPEPDVNRPNTFYGLSAGHITTGHI